MGGSHETPRSIQAMGVVCESECKLKEKKE